MKHSTAFYIISALLFVIGCFWIWINDNQIAHSGSYIYYHVDAVPQAQAVMILGASVRGDVLSKILQDRVDTAINIRKNGRADRILVSAHNGGTYYNETRAIRKYLIAQGVPESVIYQDFNGNDTYDSMYRAKHMFGIESLIIATQKFHQPRAVYIARTLGINAVGIVADTHVYRDDLRNNIREMFARIKAWFDVSIKRTSSIEVQIPITGPSNGDIE